MADVSVRHFDKDQNPIDVLYHDNGDGTYAPVAYNAVTVNQSTIGNVGQITAINTPSLTVDTAAYSAGDCIGGKVTLANAVRSSGGAARLESLMILDRANQKAAMELLVFDSDPAAATLTDQAAFVFSTDDLKVLARIQIQAGDYVTINSKAVANLRNLGAQLKAASGTSLYAAIIAVGTPTYTAGTDLQIRFGLSQD